MAEMHCWKALVLRNNNFEVWSKKFYMLRFCRDSVLPSQKNSTCISLFEYKTVVKVPLILQIYEYDYHHLACEMIWYQKLGLCCLWVMDLRMAILVWIGRRSFPFKLVVMLWVFVTTAIVVVEPSVCLSFLKYYW